MAGEKVNLYSQVDSDILALQLTTDKTFKGYHQLTLTEYDTTTVPALAAGSAIEVNGTLYKFDTEEAISTTDPVTSATVADGTVYVCIVPDTTTATAAFTATAPTWSDSKQGWYGTGGQANYRYTEFIAQKSSTDYYGKTRMFRHNGDVFYYAGDATERTTTSGTRTDENNLSVTVPLKKGCLYEIYFIFESKVGANSAYIYNGTTTYDTNVNYIQSHTENGAPLDCESASIFQIKTTAYKYFAFKNIIHAMDFASYTHKMSWSVVSTTAYVKNRKFLVKEITGLSLL